MRTARLFAALALVGAAAAIVPPAFVQLDQCAAGIGSVRIGVSGQGTMCNNGSMISALVMAARFPGSVNTTEVVESAPYVCSSRPGIGCAAVDVKAFAATHLNNHATLTSVIGRGVSSAFELASWVASGRVAAIAYVPFLSQYVAITGVDGTYFKYKSSVPRPGDQTFSFGAFDPTSIVLLQVQQYPLFKQCTPQWGDHPMGKNKKTICAVGCLMTSITSGLAGNNIAVEGQPATPGTVNQYLRTHNGFWKDTSALLESVIPTINPAHVTYNGTIDFHPTNDLSYAEIRAMVTSRRPPTVIANVLHGQHFVLVTGMSQDGDTLYINDSGFMRTTYSYKTVVGWRIFGMTDAK